MTDHVALPVDIGSRYPYTKDGKFFWPPETLSARPVSQATLDRATIDRYVSLGVKLLIADTSFEHSTLRGVLCSKEVSRLAD